MLSEDSGKYKFINILDDDKKMELIFELFIYKFYEIELKNEYKVYSQQHLNWNLENGQQDILPSMRMDTVLYGKNIDKTIIIDTKYYLDYMFFHLVLVKLLLYFLFLSLQLHQI